MWYVVAVIGGFAAGWFVHTILAAKEFDRLLWETERDKQDLINQFGKKIAELEGDKE